jgi:hypothetical protein
MLPTEWRYKRNIESDNRRLRGTTHYNRAGAQRGEFSKLVFELSGRFCSQPPLCSLSER